MLRTGTPRQSGSAAPSDHWEDLDSPPRVRKAAVLAKSIHGELPGFPAPDLGGRLYPAYLLQEVEQALQPQMAYLLLRCVRGQQNGCAVFSQRSSAPSRGRNGRLESAVILTDTGYSAASHHRRHRHFPLRRDVAPRHPGLAQSHRFIAPEHALWPPRFAVRPGSLDARYLRVVSPMAHLMGRECEMQRAAVGPSKEISVLLALHITTIASHRRSICRKVGVHSTAGLIHYAVARYASRSGVEVRSH
ncbi:MAG: hypothetical protein JWP63_1420 [Candidatus Solibacter sp.]|nr:hypothetical protein [Candidatus Solibacter sp.]